MPTFSCVSLRKCETFKCLKPNWGELWVILVKKHKAVLRCCKMNTTKALMKHGTSTNVCYWWMCGFVLVLEDLNSSPFSRRHLGVRGNLSNYSTCVLWTCRRSAYHTSRSVLLGKLWEFGYQTCFCRLFCPCRKSLLHTVSSISDWFAEHVGLHQGCQLLLILFIIFIDRISRYRWTIAGDVILQASSNEGSVRVSVKQLGWELESPSLKTSVKKGWCVHLISRLQMSCCSKAFRNLMDFVYEWGKEIDTQIIPILSFIYGNRVWGVTQRMRLCTQTASRVCPQP